MIKKIISSILGARKSDGMRAFGASDSRSKRGFTLMELLIVIAILGILGVAFVPNILKAPAKARDAVRVKKVQDVHTAIEAYYAEKGKLPVVADADPCVTDEFAKEIGMKEAPVDPSSKGSCSVDNKKLYYYHAFEVNNSPQYVVGAIMEVKTSANTKLAPGAVANLVAVPDKVENDKDGTYFIANGPI